MNRGGVQVAGLDEFLDLGNGDASGLGTEGIEVLRRLLVDEVPVPVAVAGVHQGEVARDSPLEDVLDVVEDPCFLGLR